jgi:hypothetical protein
MAGPAALAADGIDVRRGDDATVFGSCVPSLVVDNRSAETIDYLQVDLVLTLADGRQRTIELQSAYHEGVLYPIAPGGRAILRQHLDTSRALGVACDQVTARKVERILCEEHDGVACTLPIGVQP